MLSTYALYYAFNAKQVSHSDEPATPHLHIHNPLPFVQVVVGSNITPKTTVPMSQRLSTGFVLKIVSAAEPHFHTMEVFTEQD